LDRKRQHAGVIIEGTLHTIAVVCVQVNIRNSKSQGPEPLYHDCGVVVDAETGGPVRHRMVQTTSEVDCMPDHVIGNDLSGCESTTYDEGTRLVHTSKRRGIGTGETVPVELRS